MKVNFHPFSFKAPKFSLLNYQCGMEMEMDIKFTCGD